MEYRKGNKSITCLSITNLGVTSTNITVMIVNIVLLTTVIRITRNVSDSLSTITEFVDRYGDKIGNSAIFIDDKKNLFTGVGEVIINNSHNVSTLMQYMLDNKENYIEAVVFLNDNQEPIVDSMESLGDIKDTLGDLLVMSHSLNSSLVEASERFDICIDTGETIIDVCKDTADICLDPMG